MITYSIFPKIRTTVIAIAAFFLMSGSKTANAQGIIYVDCDPNIIAICNAAEQGIDIDFDNDGVRDARAYGLNASGIWQFLVTYGNWELLSMNDEETEPIPTAPGGWGREHSYNNDYIYYGYCFKKFGFRRKVGDDRYYAWARVYPRYDEELGYIITLYEYAYCTIPNYPLVWGQTEIAALDENNATGRCLSVFPNPSANKVGVEFINTELNEIVSVSLFDISGRLLKTQQSGFGSIDISGLATGMYVMRVALADGKVFEEKIVKK